MGQNQPRESDGGKRTEATGSPHNPNNLKDRASVGSFQPRSAVNSASGTGKKANPGKPT